MRQGITVLFVTLILSVTVGCANSLEIADRAPGQPDVTAKGAAGEGKLSGRVVRGPTSPVGRAGMPSPWEPASGVRLVIMTQAGREIGFVVTDAQGAYSISLPPGTYRVRTTSLTGIEFSKDLPATVVITEGREARLDIHIDTGIR